MRFDRIVMNPPFARSQDVTHVTKAFGHLLPGGRLVSVMAAGVTFRQDRAYREFRSLLDSVDGTIEQNPADSFKLSGTAVNTVTVMMERAA